MIINWIFFLYISLTSAAAFGRKRERVEVDGSDFLKAKRSFFEVFEDVPKPTGSSAEDDPAMLFSMISLHRTFSIPRAAADVKRQFEEAIYVRNYARLDELISYGAIPSDIEISTLESLLGSNDHASLYILHRLLEYVPEVSRTIAYRSSRFANIVAVSNGPHCEKLLFWLDRFTSFVENDPESLISVVMELITTDRYEFIKHVIGSLEYSQGIALVENSFLHLFSLEVWHSVIQFYQFLQFIRFEMNDEIISSALAAAYALKSYEMTEEIISLHPEAVLRKSTLPFARLNRPEYVPEILQIYHSACEAFGEQGIFDYSFSLVFEDNSGQL